MNSSTPVRVSAGESAGAQFGCNNGYLCDIVAVSAGGYNATGSTYALHKDGYVFAWGSNGFGQLGDGTNTRKLTPVLVRAPLAGVPAGYGNYLKDIVAITGGSHAHHVTAIANDGTVWSWGANSAGQVGDGTFTNRNRPVKVVRTGGSILTDVLAVAAGESHTMALLLDGTVWG